MTVKQISLITMKSGQKANLPDSLDEAEICFTTDTGEIFIGAPNFPAVQYRSDQSASTNGQGISPYRNIKVLTEFDVTKTITGDFYTQEALDRTVVPLSGTPYKIYTFEPGVNSIIASYSLYDGQNVNLVGELFISVFEGDAMVCNAGQQVDGIQFTSKLNSSNEIELYSVNETDSIYTMYISAKCWKSNVAEWDGTKGNGIKPFCLNMKGEDNGLPSIAICTDVKLSDLSNNQFLKYNSTDKKWENTAINYSDISGEVPSGKQYLSTLLDVKLTNPSNNQYLKYSSADQKWENTTINYSDITGTPPVAPPSIATCTDVSLNNLTGSQILQYSSTDQKWENAAIPPAQAAWTVSSVIASGSTITDATKCTTTLINVVSSDGYSQGISSITYDSTARNSNNIMGYLVCAVRDDSDLDFDSSNLDKEYGYNHNVNYAGYYAPTVTGSGSGATLYFEPLYASYVDTLELSIKLFSVSPTVGDIITGTFYWDPDPSQNVTASGEVVEFTVTSVTSTSVTLKNNNTGQYFPKGSSYSDIMNSKKNDIIYVDEGNPRDGYGTMFMDWVVGNPYIWSSSYNQPLTVYEESNKKYNFTLNDPQYIISAKQYIIIVDFTNVSVNSPGSNYAVGDKISLYNWQYYQVTDITSVPTRGIVMPDPQPTGSMVIVKNNTNNKPINVYSTTVSGNGNLLANIPDSTYKNYETKFIRTDTGWTKF